MSIPLLLCKGSSGLICTSMMVTGQCQPADQGDKVSEGWLSKGHWIATQGGGFVPARERICSMRGNSISPLRERTHSHSRRVTVMPSPVYFSFHLRSHHCCAHHSGPSWTKSTLTSSWKQTQQADILCVNVIWGHSSFGNQNRIWKI